MKFTLHYDDSAEMILKLKTIAARFGYALIPTNPGTITIGKLARLVHRPVACVSRALGRPTCPPFVCRRGKRRIIALELNDRLLSFLQNPPNGRPARREGA